MILADTSVWIGHLNHSDPNMSRLLDDGELVVHPFVLGEIGLGSMPDWHRVMYRLARLPRAMRARDEAVLDLIGGKGLEGSGIGYVDAHLLAACLIARDTRLWTRDRRLGLVAARLGINAGPMGHS